MRVELPASPPITAHEIQRRRLAGMACALILFLGGLVTDPPAIAAPQADNLSPVTVTNVHQVRLLASQSPDACYSIHLEGDVWWANPAQGRLVLKDDSGAEELELTPANSLPQAGQHVRIDGSGTITRTGAAFRLGAFWPVVDNDGVHGMVEKLGGVYLEAGRNPIRVDWFNGSEDYGLKVEYEGPRVTRQPIPDSSLFRIPAAEEPNATNHVHGLDYRVCAAPTELLPDFDHSPVLKSGFTTNFNLGMLDQTEHIGVSFTGYLEIAQAGFYTFYTTSDDGSRLYVGTPSLRAETIGRSGFPKPRQLAVGGLLPEDESGQWCQVEGKVTFFSRESDGVKLELSAGSSRMWALVANDSTLSAETLLNQYVVATGYAEPATTLEHQPILATLLVPGADGIVLKQPYAPAVENPGTNSGALPLLVNAAEVHRLRREEAQRGYPVKVSGVVTSLLPEHQAFTIQDSTRGLYIIDFSSSRSDPPFIGELLEVEGRTDPSLFAPVVYASNVLSLGAASLPEPVHPTWDQLINGSLDAQYVEIQGILTDVQSNKVSLLTRDGVISTDLHVNGVAQADLKRYEDALVRIRGCLFARWDGATHKVRVDEIRILGADITVDQPAPADLFSIPAKTAADLLLFDPQASDIQRVKVRGQVIRVRGAECFMMDATNGVRFLVRQPVELQPGDLVEVVGFPQLGGASPVLREAVVKKTGSAPLPAPRALDQEQLIRTDNDSTLVQIDAVLVGLRDTPSGESLEMRAGLRTFLAWLPAATKAIPGIPVGSQLELTGTYASLGGSRATGHDATSFELLLNSPVDVVLLARPPWWTLQRLLIMLGALACGLAVTVLWITQLRVKVEQRTAELEIQIRERQRVEQQRALEQERARIAQDLHDELGSGLTEISMLSTRARPANAQDEKRGRYLEQMGEKSRQLVSALDEIVWAMNPTHDSVASMVSYFSLYADRFLGLANITWRLEGPFTAEDHPVVSRHRHQLFLAFKEALANVVHHSGATEVRFNLAVKNGQIRLTIADNGHGVDKAARTEAMDGLNNMRLRLEKLGGRFEMESAATGTTVRFCLPIK
jgi:signal transduction histidine kinase